MTSRDTTPRMIEPQIVYGLSEFSKRPGWVKRRCERRDAAG